jgi:phosphatidylserine/phosphatidylglycerophosphate/cardiolipin synthase-like enzyme
MEAALLSMVRLTRNMLPAVATLALFLCARGAAGEPLRFTTVREVAERIASARSVMVSAYTLSPRGAMARALLAAGTRGAHVRVVLDGHAFGAAQHANLATGLELRQAHVRVDYTQEPLHMKAAAIDDAVYLSDRNWTSRSRAEVVLQDALPQDKPIVLHAVDGTPGSNGHLWTRKGDALQAEARVLASNASHDAAMETESFGSGTKVYDALTARRARGDRVRLIVAALEERSKGQNAERAALARLAAAGVEIRVGTSGEKIALDGEYGWLGSANATRGLANQIDWGMTTQGAMTAALREKFEENWSAASSEL